MQTMDEARAEVARLKQENAALQQRIADEKIGPRCAECGKQLGAVACTACAVADGNPYGGVSVPVDREESPCDCEYESHGEDGTEIVKACQLHAQWLMVSLRELRDSERKDTEAEVAAWLEPLFPKSAAAVRRGEYRNPRHDPKVTSHLGTLIRGNPDDVHIGVAVLDYLTREGWTPPVKP